MTIFDILSFYQSQAFSVVTDPLIFLHVLVICDWL